jgi:glutathione S-transferase
MAKPILVIANKNYSSWSLRPYMALKMAGIPFEEKLIRFGEPAFGKAVRRISSAGRVPVLIHNGMVIWDSLAILEYISESWPKKSLWPKSRHARVVARSVCAEMHSGFQALRNACPMNIRRTIQPVTMSENVLRDVQRIEQIWLDCRKQFGGKEPYLFGRFSNADAMFAPVVSRIETYCIPVKPQSRQYMDTILQSTAFQSWKADALKEKWIVPEDEVD